MLENRQRSCLQQVGSAIVKRPVHQGRACLSHGGLRRLSGTCNWKKLLTGNAHGSPAAVAASVIATSPTYETVAQESMVLSLPITRMIAAKRKYG